jgi:hypothetical protein
MVVVHRGGRHLPLPSPARATRRVLSWWGGEGGGPRSPYDSMPLQLEMLGGGGEGRPLSPTTHTECPSSSRCWRGGGRADRSPLRLTRPPWLEVPEGGAGRPPDPTTHGGNSLWWGIGERPGPRAGTRSSALYQPSAPARSRTPAGGTKLAPRRGAELRPVVLTSSPDELPGQGRLPGAW